MLKPLCPRPILVVSGVLPGENNLPSGCHPYGRNANWSPLGTTDQLGCGLPHEDKNNPRSYHTPPKLLYVLISICFGVEFTLLNHKLLNIVCPSALVLSKSMAFFSEEIKL
jgi:hypothetical protein